MRRFPTSLWRAVCLLFFGVCGGLSLSAKEEPEAPVPKTPLSSHAAATYHFEDGEWYQSRVTAEATGPIEDAGADRWYYSFESRMSVWRFNPESGDYDIPIPGSLGASTTLSFFYSKGSDGDVLMMTEAMGSRYALGGAGLPNGGGTAVRMDISPPIHTPSNQARIENELHLTAITRVSVQPSPASKERGVPVKSTKVSRTIVVKRLPGKRADFAEVDR